MKKKLIKIICGLVFTAAIITILTCAIQLIDVFIKKGNSAFDDILSIESTADLILAFTFSFLELKAGFSLLKSIKEEDKFEWYKAFPGLISALIAPISLSYLTLFIAELTTSLINKQPLNISNLNLFAMVPLLIVTILSGSIRMCITKRQALQLNICILINSAITFIFIVINKESYQFTSNIFDIMSTIAHFINIIITGLIVTYSIINIVENIKHPDYLEYEAREHEVVEVLKETEKYEVVRVYAYKSPTPKKTILPKVLIIISSSIFGIYGLYYFFIYSIPLLSDFDLSFIISSSSVSSLLDGLFDVVHSLLVPFIFILLSYSYIYSIFIPEANNRYSMSGLSGMHLYAKIIIYGSVLIDLIDVFSDFILSGRFDISVFSIQELLYIVPFIIGYIISSVTKRRRKYVADNLKNGDSFYEYRKDAGLYSLQSFLTTIIPGIAMLIFEKDTLINNILYIFLMIASTLGTIAMLIQMKYPMDEFTKVKRKKLPKQELLQEVETTTEAL